MSDPDPVLDEIMGLRSTVTALRANLAEMRKERDTLAIRSKNYAEFSHEWRKRAEAAEARATALAAEVERLRHAVEFTAKIAWKPDPEHASAPFTDPERLNAIKWHPTIRAIWRAALEGKDND